jgi:flagellar biosynthesis GTPase FlhF
MSAAEPVAQPVQRDVQAAKTAHYEQQRSHEIVDMLREEMAALRKEFALSRQMQPWQQTLGLSPDIQKLTLAMQEVGMPSGLRSLLTDSIQQLETLDEAWPVVQRMLVEAMDRPAVEAPTQGVHALCGPSGAGKTSMLGRLAYAAAQVHGAEKQVMISYGDQRPGAWSQIQLLASQAGASCFRAADMGMLQTLLDDLQGKTVWIDTPGADFSAQAQQLQSQLTLNLHAVLPVDATVTSVQKILQNPEIRWSSLMLTKVDEAAYPWPLIKGLCEQPLAVSCMAEDSKINVPALAFGAERLVDLAMTPLQALLPEIQHLSAAQPSAKVARKPRAKKAAVVAAEIQPKSRAVKPRATTMSSAKALHG